MTHDVSALTGIGANKLCRTICTRLGNEKIALLSQPFSSARLPAGLTSEGLRHGFCPIY